MPSTSKRRRQPATSRQAQRPNNTWLERPGTRWWAIGLLVAAGVWAYASSFNGVFMADDVFAIVNNEHIRTLWPVPLSAPHDTTLSGRPFASLTFALNYAIAPATGGANNAFGYHLVNLVVHILAAVTLFGIVRRSLRTPSLHDHFGSGSTGLATTVALIWLVHPLQTGSVTFIVQRVESLMGLFFLLTLYCAIRATETELRQRRWIVLAVISCALGMATKETMAGAPLLVALWIWIFRPDLWRTGAARTLLLGLAATWVILGWLVASQPRSESAGFIGGWTAPLYFRTQAEVIVHYLRLAFWPARLVLQYAWGPTESWLDALPELSLLGLLAVATGVALKRRSPFGFLGAWFFLILAPSSSVVPVVTEVAAEHRMYLPLAAVVAAVVFAFVEVIRTRGRSWAGFARMGSLAIIGVAIALAVQTHARNRVYASEDVMVADIVRGRPQNARAQLTYGANLLAEGRYTDAVTHLRVALTLPLPLGTDEQPRALMHMYLGSALCAQGLLAEGSQELQRALAINPRLGEAYGFLGEANLSQGRTREAVVYLRRAIDELPAVPAILTRTAWVLSTSRDPQVRNGAQAAAYAEQAVSLTSRRDPHALESLAAANAELGRFELAESILGEAIALATRAGDGGLAAELREQLGQYQRRAPIRSTVW